MISDLITRWVWLGQPVDSLVLDAPHHDGSTAALARQVYHRVVVRLASVAVFRRQWLVLWAALAVACGAASVLSVVFMLASPLAFLVGSQLRELLGSWMTWVTLAATFVALPIFMAGCISAQVREEAVEFAGGRFFAISPATRRLI